MNHKGTITITTDRLVLRRFLLDDVQQIFDNWTSDHDLFKYARQRYHISVDETRTYVNDIVESYADPKTYYWVITLADTPIGRINITEINEPVESVCVSYMLGREWWSKGYITEALNAVVRFFFEEVGVNRIEGRNDVHNPASEKVMVKSGFKYEGLLRQGGRNSYGFVDCKQYAIIAEDYMSTGKVRQ